MNISLRIQKQSEIRPSKVAVIHHDKSITFQGFEERSNQFAQYFLSLGITKGTRTLLFVKPCLDFSIITFSLFKIGAVPVLIDPGMGMKNLLRSISQVRPEAMISIGLVHWVRRIKRAPFSHIKIKVSLNPVGGRTHYLYKSLESFSKSFAPIEVNPKDLAAILFTSGGTGIPKGVEYTHEILNSQTETLQKIFDLSPEHKDLPGFPLFALFTLAMGMTSVIPDMDPTRPSQCDPRKLVRNILTHQITFCAGSPAIWERVGEYCLKNNIQLGSVKQVVMFGAPVRSDLHRMFKKILTKGDTYTPYGATECLPVCLMSGSEVLRDTEALTNSGAGVCIGRAVPGVEIKIARVSDIPEVEVKEVGKNQLGEIVVKGPMVTPGYFEMPEETQKAKILTSTGLWHRMGDMGRIDEDGRLWFLGRKTHRVAKDGVIYCPIEVEAIFNLHPKVKRTALVNFKGELGLVIERHDKSVELDHTFLEEISRMGEHIAQTKLIKDFWLSAGFPVDIRHNIKIDRLLLTQMVNKGTRLCQRRLSRRWQRSST